MCVFNFSHSKLKIARLAAVVAYAKKWRWETDNGTKWTTNINFLSQSWLCMQQWVYYTFYGYTQPNRNIHLCQEKALFHKLSSCMHTTQNTTNLPLQTCEKKQWGVFIVWHVRTTLALTIILLIYLGRVLGKSFRSCRAYNFLNMYNKY